MADSDITDTSTDTTTDQKAIVDPTSPESGGLPSTTTSTSGQTTGGGPVGSVPIAAPTSPSAATQDLLPATGSTTPVTSTTPTTTDTGTGATPTTATGSRVQATSADTSATTGVTTGGAPTDTSTTADDYLTKILPLLNQAGALPTEYVTETIDPSGAVQFGTTTTDPGTASQAAQLAADQAAGTGAYTNDYDTGRIQGGDYYLGAFSPTSADRDPWAQQYYGQGDTTTNVDAVRAQVSDPAWTVYNDLIAKYPSLAGKIDNPDALMEAIAGQSAGALDPESNLAATSAELVDLILNQPAVVQARGGTYVDITQDPSVQAAIAQGNEQAIANFNYQQQYGGGRGWTKELSTGATNVLSDPLVESALAFFTGPLGGELGAAADIGSVAGTAVVGGTVGAAESEAKGGNPLLGAAIGAAGGAAGSSLSGDLPTGGTPGEYATSTFGTPDVSGATGITTDPTGGAADWYTAAPPGSTTVPTGGEADWYTTTTPTATTITPGVTPADTMAATAGGGADVTAGMDPSAYYAGPSGAGDAATVFADPGSLNPTMAAGGTDPFDLTAPGGGDFGVPTTYDLPPAFDTTSGGGTDVTSITDTGPPDITQAPEDYSWLEDPNALQPEPGSVDVPRATAATTTTGDVTDSSFNQTPTQSGSWWNAVKGAFEDVPWSQIGTYGKYGLEGLGLVGAPLMSYLGYKKNQQQLQNLTDQIKQSTAPLSTEGQQLMDMYNKGQLPPGQQAVIDQWLQSTKAQAKQAYVNAGMADSSAEMAAEAYASQTASGMTATDFQTLLNQAQSLIAGGAQGTQAAANAQVQGDQQLLNEINAFMNAYGGILRGIS